jgi:hypothetical protein
MTQPNPLLTTVLAAVKKSTLPATCRRSNASAPLVSDDGFASFNNDRHFPLPPGALKHLLQLLGVFLDIKIDRVVAIG